MLRTFARAVTVEGRADAEKKFESVAQIVPIIVVEAIRAIVRGELSTKPISRPLPCDKSRT